VLTSGEPRVEKDILINVKKVMPANLDLCQTIIEISDQNPERIKPMRLKYKAYKAEGYTTEIIRL
ncbi:MAG: DNA polymerase III subunit chi, partial [Francisellaceae bacterium]